MYTGEVDEVVRKDFTEPRLSAELDSEPPGTLSSPMLEGGPLVVVQNENIERELPRVAGWGDLNLGDTLAAGEFPDEGRERVYPL